MAQLRDYEDEFRRLGVQTLIISFGAEHWARAWLQATESPFPLLLDPERAAYQAYGLGRSFIRVWSPKVMWHYLKLALAGEKLQPVQGDPHQLGGDVIVDAAGVIQLIYQSKDPVDRPPVAKLLAVLRDLAQGASA